MISNEYAKALFELANDYNQVEIIADNFKSFIEILKENQDYIKVLTYPTISSDEKKKCVVDALAGFNDIFIDFLKVLIDNNRFNQIFEIYESFTKNYLSYKNIVNVKVISCKPLSKREANELEESLVNYYQGKKITLVNEIDDTIIGGIRVITDGESLDLSVINKLNRLKATI